MILSLARQHVPVLKAAPSTADSEPGLFSTLTYTALGVAGLVPIIGEVADGANALFYLAEGNKVDAAFRTLLTNARLFLYLPRSQQTTLSHV